VATAACLLLAGCGDGGPPKPELYRVTGTVTYKGHPVPGAKVMFLGDGKSPPSVGITDDAGNFTLSSLAGSGAVAGKHTVAIVKNTDAEPADTMMSMEEAAAAARNPPKRPAEGSLIPAKYGNAATSGLEFEVATSGSNHFEIELKD
jgi:hypothetical protein